MKATVVVVSWRTEEEDSTGYFLERNFVPRAWHPIPNVVDVDGRNGWQKWTTDVDDKLLVSGKSYDGFGQRSTSPGSWIIFSAVFGRTCLGIFVVVIYKRLEKADNRLVFDVDYVEVVSRRLSLE